MSTPATPGDDVDMEALRAKYSRPKEVIAAEAAAKYGAGDPLRNAVGGASAADPKYTRVVMCQQCQAHGTIKVQYGYRVLDEQCPMCEGEGIIKPKVTYASDELQAKVARVENLIEAAESLEELDALEAALKERSHAAIDKVLSTYPAGAGAPEEAEAEAAEAAAAPSGGAMSAEELAALDAKELKEKQEAAAKKAAEKEALEEANIKKAQALEGSGKRAAGGVHKFDAEEVDVHGGSATADDFMDAFGFGDCGDGGGDFEEEDQTADGNVMSAEELKALEAKELKEKQEAAAKKAAEKEALEEANMKKAQALEGSGKRAAGGVHKFDADEVDVHGGSATADDFMDAFGF